MILPKNGHIIESNFYCNDCCVKCEDCGDFILKDNAFETHDGFIICENCKDENYYFCVKCEKLIHCDDAIYIEDTNEYVCNNCSEIYYYKCECCNKYFSQSGIYETYDNNWVCKNCYEDSYETCDDCNKAVPNDYAYFNENNDCYYCPNCQENHYSNIYDYHNYEDYCKKQMYGETAIKEFFGLEIEVSGDRNYADNFLNLVPDVILMNDSSIYDGGFEIITEPMTRKYISEKFLPKLEEGMNFLNKAGFKGYNRGGIHIHISQEVFSKKMLCVLINVLYSYSETDIEVWKAITQRRQSEIDRWCQFKDARDITDILNDSCMFPKISNERYTAVNYDDRTKTYEFRIFNSSTRIERIKKNLQTVYSLIDYAKFKESHYITANTGDYIEFIKRNSIFYPELYSFIYEMGIVQRFEEERIAA